MVVLAQLVRASDCGSEGRGFEPHTPPKLKIPVKIRLRAYFFILANLKVFFLFLDIKLKN